MGEVVKWAAIVLVAYIVYKAIVDRATTVPEYSGNQTAQDLAAGGQLAQGLAALVGAGASAYQQLQASGQPGTAAANTGDLTGGAGSGQPVALTDGNGIPIYYL